MAGEGMDARTARPGAARPGAAIERQTYEKTNFQNRPREFQWPVCEKNTSVVYHPRQADRRPNSQGPVHAQVAAATDFQRRQTTGC